MTDRDRRRRHVDRLRGIAAGVLEPLIDPARPDATGDRADLARLMIEISDAWRSALADENATLVEQLRWSRVCVSATQIAERMDAEELAKRESTTGNVRRLVPNQK